MVIEMIIRWIIQVGEGGDCLTEKWINMLGKKIIKQGEFFFGKSLPAHYGPYISPNITCCLSREKEHIF